MQGACATRRNGAKGVTYQKVQQIRDYLKSEPCSFFEFEAAAYSQMAVMHGEGGRHGALEVAGDFFSAIDPEVETPS
eukprot:4547802-Pyramimonas_sp.AAC.1